MSHKILFGIKDNKAVHASEVDSGLKCNAVCPLCKSRLVAKKGNKNKHHFTHYQTKNCIGGFETSLHLAAKEIIARHKEFVIPDVYLKFPESYKKNELIYNKQTIKIDRVYLEKKIDDIIPDIIIESAGQKLIVEVFVTHEVDDEKIDKIKRIGISAIEIDLSDWITNQDRDDLEEIIINGVMQKKWIYNRVEDRYYNMFKNKAKPFKGSFGRNSCPLGKSLYKDNSDRSFRWVDCMYCEYCFSAHESPNCLGHSLVSKIDDLKKSYTELKEEMDIEVERTRTEKINRKHCLRCNTGILVKRKGIRGTFYGCNNYPDCKFTIQIKD